MRAAGCPLCDGDGGQLVFRGDRFRVIRATEPGFPAFYRVIWTDHVSEFSDLAPADRALCMEAVACVERVVRQQLQPAKINLAALGNMVPHLHWHVIARFEWDSRFPAPVWAPAQREAPPQLLQGIESALPALDDALRAALAAGASNHRPS
ncbi:HIT family protein [Ramlibacter solisilvae]|uniref:DeoR faimly transcriptional regulator n=1 Tax=Ramlibacter tataouinensis TaxID=94132 RepID=A0A127JQM4_9BURK|nr:HIT family protein [Ramlibacter tataouinensis]AMO22249.1 DeoR faimly transcriptional regulator [Ramlibacter tataouinensis]